jgi:hypothetical protein
MGGFEGGIFQIIAIYQVIAVMLDKFPIDCD